MKEFKGTPGPWFVGDFGGVEGNGSFIGANPERDGCTYVAKVTGVSTVDVANSKLIAAAPELLKELIAVLDSHEKGLYYDWDRAEEAINKALGEEK